MTTASLLAILGNVHLESLTISADVMPGHFVARAVIFDLQPSQMVAAIAAVDDAIKSQTKYALARRTGWRASSDSLTVYFYSWQPQSAQEGAVAA
jgi:protein-arginine kinase